MALFIINDGNLLADDAEALVNPVNTTGAMGLGLANKFKLCYPDMFADYRAACKRKEVKIGRMHVFKAFDPFTPNNERWIINFPTKQWWGHSSKVEYIEQGMEDLVQTIKDLDIQSVAIPALGCGAGELGWSKVRKIIIMAFDGTDREVRLYCPYPPKLSDQ